MRYGVGGWSVPLCVETSTLPDEQKEADEHHTIFAIFSAAPQYQ
jgi:hypothetical protein